MPFGAMCFIFADWMLQTGQMLGTESAGDVVEGTCVGEKFGRVFLLRKSAKVSSLVSPATD